MQEFDIEEKEVKCGNKGQASWNGVYSSLLVTVVRHSVGAGATELNCCQSN